MYFVYLLQSLKDNKFYIGQTENVVQRLAIHNSGQVISTKSRRPFRLVGYKTFDFRNEARWFEYNLKNHSDKKRKFINELRNKGLRPLGSWRKVSDPEGLRPGGR
ncbi:hypothetical protein A2697_02655 [Candidatus Curtissbacteria bacterium RIFCSPHIGHO2_01_FULL_41_44]|uniref:GIY-YIG domain-containing protein n=1 Tax=Candidatus Curtissbacteria bacterium RIFCSPLOWO2_01_FULL_42_50 TaxID=1797730 RepID=A0A1F5H889_9BACT|nr:MAG: hypothetical protein A2697_02655 [Candidatus Curtissbacteria bacterium RIFCSPHIGHO2_01_FULL_41_44]OGD92469.1 MAG: hypothetical protein A3C33_04745 [Candidatus Curtissbacteria bacterium RIFCSPHIGHO2_02_FULL_42_58]OGD96262.1 MAG: hypothetical protein A3E71_02240 [Candidatus Curtissbacteria bacterium RIFCSPHIGHO2_12_FULL_42_33]OGE00351.1 MAG: hypothetical protein A3B54_01420 [Candidatus Curtissbacteria bacterium RIFCSPLOWO2_01_FULL_42_50]OGE03820.1 MAG: hypothetical protein A3G16_05090 [Ca